jgi:hypothetical protein
MSAARTKTAADKFDGFIKNKWQDIFRRDVDVRLGTGGRYVPNGGVRGVKLLRENVNAFDEAILIWGGPEADLDTSEPSYDRIVAQAGPRYTWEGFLIDPNRPWASAVPPVVRERISADLDRRVEFARAHDKALADEAEKKATEMDGDVIVYMNAKRVEKGNEPLTEEQESSVRESRRSRRAERLAHA